MSDPEAFKLAYKARANAVVAEHPIPSNIRAGLDRYVLERVPPGSFLLACLENDLKGAVGNADVWSMASLANIVLYIYNVLPMDSQGSPEKVRAWLSADRRL